MAHPSPTTQFLRDKIKAIELIDRAQDSVLGDDTKPLTPAEMGAIKLLLNKVIPDLKGVEQITTHEGKLEHSLTWKYVD